MGSLVSRMRMDCWPAIVHLFPKKAIWVENVPSKLAFFAWEATWGRILTIDRLQKRGWQILNRCYLCGSDEENVSHLLIHCTVASVLWGMTLSLFGAQWVFPETVKEVITSWKGSFVGKKRKRIWRSIPLFIFWTVWKERNRLAFRGGELAIQKIKYSFVCNMWGWAKLYNGAESRSLIGFLEWIASSWGLLGFLLFLFFCCVAVVASYTPCMLCGVCLC